VQIWKSRGPQAPPHIEDGKTKKGGWKNFPNEDGAFLAALDNPLRWWQIEQNAGPEALLSVGKPSS
jgi:hypothetical protein